MKRLGALIFDGFEMLDLFGPLEMFGMYPDDVRIETVAPVKGTVTANGGPVLVADHGYAGSPDFDLLLVPGGPGTRPLRGDAATADWLRHQAGGAELVMSVCTGSALLAAAGLLNGRKATSNKRAFDRVADPAPDVDWQKSARWVEDGTFMTSSGVSAGTDMSLAAIARLWGRDAADTAALWAEYTWNDDPQNDPFAVE